MIATGRIAAIPSACSGKGYHVMGRLKMTSLSPVRAVSPVAPYQGGKKHLAAQIVPILNAVPHEIYAEVFVGMGGVFFRRSARPKSEVINDFSRDVSTLFRILQRHFPQFLDTLKWQLSSRAEFDRLMQVDPATLTDLERAARFLYLQRLAFGGKITGRSFGIDPRSPARFDLTRLSSMLEDVHERLAGVMIECLDYKEFIRRYDADGTLFYLDPPYYGCESDYGASLFGREEFPRMAAQLAGIRGRFILSLNDCPEVREIFAGFHIRAVKTVYTISQQTQPVGEVLIANFEAVRTFEQNSLF